MVDLSPGSFFRGPYRLQEEAMLTWAEALGKMCRGGELILLEGGMGAGKTTFTRAFARGMGVDDPSQVCSPTFTVCMRHQGAIPLYHVDLFRLGELSSMPEGSRLSTSAFESLGLEHDDLIGADRVVMVEWSELWADPPEESLRIRLERPPMVSEFRELTFSGTGEAFERALKHLLKAFPSTPIAKK